MPKLPSQMGPPNENWMVLTDDGPEYFDDQEEAREEAERAMEDYLLEGEVELAKKVVMARVVAYVAPAEGDNDILEESEDEEDFGSDRADVYDYELLDVVDIPAAVIRAH